MIQFFYEMVVKAKSKNCFCWKALYKFNKVLLNIVYPISQKMNQKIGVSEEGKVIVSLTTYPERVNQVWKTITSLLNQTMKPQKVILWLAKEQFQGHQLPESIIRLKGRGLEICYCEDLKSHKKYFEVMKQYPEKIIVTADDDILYPENHLEKLWEAHLEFPSEVICQWSHQITFNGNSEFVPYNEWMDNAKEEPSFATLAVGCNGILYPPKALPKEAFDKEGIQKYALTADDLWLKCMELLAGIKTINCNETILIYYNVLSTRQSGLWINNTGKQKNNDKVWNNLMKNYPEAYRCLLKEKNRRGIHA